MDERVGWANLSLFSFATCIHYNIHQSIVVKKLCLTEAETVGWDAGRSRRRKSHGESVVGRWKHDNHGRTRKREEEVRIEVTGRTPIVPSSPFPSHETRICIAAGVVYVCLQAPKFQTTILSELNGLLQFNGHFINMRQKLTSKAVKRGFNL